MDKYAIKYIKLANPAWATVPTTEYIPTGPDNADNPSLPVNNDPNIKIIVETILPNLENAYFIA